MSPDISDLKRTFKGDIVTASDPGYKDAIARWAANAERPARIVAFVKDANDVVLALMHARSNNLKIAIRCGGHSPAGASSITDGLVIDLSRYFNYAIVDEEKRTARVGGGSIWHTVDTEAIKYGLATTGGTVNHTGVAGLLLGGGYGFLMGQHGMVIDNLLEATVVTANGEVLTANETENPDLFWGIRGGGSNFGVCTEFVLKMYPQRRTVFGGMIIFSVEKLDALVAETTRWWEQVKENEAMLQIITRDPSGHPCIALSVFYNGNEDEGRANYKMFYDLNPIFDGAREIPYEELNAQYNDMFVPGGNYYLKSAFQLGPQLGTMKSMSERVAELNAEPGNEIEHSYGFEYFPSRKMLSVPQDATAHFRFQRTTTVCFLRWVNNTTEAEKTARRHARELTDIVVSAETEIPGGINSGYGNYSSEADTETTLSLDRVLDESKSRALFGPNYERLQLLKTRYDPENIFSKWFAIAPKA